MSTENTAQVLQRSVAEDHRRALLLALIPPLFLISVVGAVLLMLREQPQPLGAVLMSAVAVTSALSWFLLLDKQRPVDRYARLILWVSGLMLLLRIASVLLLSPQSNGGSALFPIFAYVPLYMAMLAVLLPYPLSLRAGVLSWLLVATTTTVVGWIVQQSENPLQRMSDLMTLVWLGYPIFLLLNIGGARRYTQALKKESAARAQTEALNSELEQRVKQRTQELNLANQRLAADREFLNAVLDHVDEGIVACDAQGQLTLFNRAAREFHGLPAEAVPATDWASHYDLFAADGKTPLQTDQVPLFRALQGEQVRDAGLVIAPKQLPARHLLSSGQSIHTPDGMKIGAVISMLDITEQQKRERQLRHLHRRQQLLVEVATASLVGNDANTVIQRALNGLQALLPDIDIRLLANGPHGQLGSGELRPAAQASQSPLVLDSAGSEALLGALSQQALLRLSDIADSDLEESLIAALRDERIQALMAFTLRQSADQKLLLMLSRPHPHDWQPQELECLEAIGQQLAVVLRDVRSREELIASEAALERRATELERSNAELERFAYIASHDLQAPLRSISGFTQLLGKRLGSAVDEDGKEFIALTHRSVVHMQGLIDDLLKLSRIGRQPLTISSVDLGEAVQTACSNLDAHLQASGAKLQLPQHYPRVMADQALLSVVLQNLIENAIKFCRDQAPEIRLAVDCSDDSCELGVSDNGIGMHAGDLDRIFEMFRRLQGQDDFPGNGIGLASCQKIIHRLGGSIHASSPGPGKGSRIAFRLPLAPAQT